MCICWKFSRKQVPCLVPALCPALCSALTLTITSTVPGSIPCWLSQAFTPEIAPHFYALCIIFHCGAFPKRFPHFLLFSCPSPSPLCCALQAAAILLLLRGAEVAPVQHPSQHTLNTHPRSHHILGSTPSSPHTAPRSTTNAHGGHSPEDGFGIKSLACA